MTASELKADLYRMKQSLLNTQQQMKTKPDLKAELEKICFDLEKDIYREERRTEFVLESWANTEKIINHFGWKTVNNKTEYKGFEYLLNNETKKQEKACKQKDLET